MWTPFKNVTLTNEDVAYTEKRARENPLWETMPAHNRQTLRYMLRREEKELLYQNQDYVYGEDSGSQVGERN